MARLDHQGPFAKVRSWASILGFVGSLKGDFNREAWNISWSFYQMYSLLQQTLPGHLTRAKGYSRHCEDRRCLSSEVLRGSGKPGI